MALPRKVLLKKVSKFESKELEKYKIDPLHLPDFDKLLDDVYMARRPTPTECFNRTDLIRVFNAIAKEIYGNSSECPTVVGFGSFVMDMYNTGSDLDLSINFGNPSVQFPREKKIQTLRKFAKKFYSLQRKGHVTSIQTIMSARVPIVKVIDYGTRIECDLSVENWDGILKSQLVHVISAIDDRFQKLSFLMKSWAKANGINSSKDRTLNSLSIISLVAFHLQTRQPPILPPFSVLFKDGTDPANVRKNVDSFLNYGKANEESLALLFVALLIKLASVEKLWQKGLCASVFEGSWISKTWDSRCGPISVEDFTERSENVSRAVGVEEVKKIYDCIHRSIIGLLFFLDGKMPAAELKELLFGSVDVPTLKSADKNEATTSNSPTVHYPDQIKKMRFSRNSEETRVKNQQQGQQTTREWDAWHCMNNRRTQVNGWGWSGPVNGQSLQNVAPQPVSDQHPVDSNWDSKITPCISPPVLHPAAVAERCNRALPQPVVSTYNSLSYDASRAQPHSSNVLPWPSTGTLHSGQPQPIRR
ncbi:protein HESO1-like [Syzygium oleosum]|uniref:protein HESO1-like n=1 Tax=Syzygium oleosum TaxID=219896 RepID=UPI0024BBB109|nr:protein HESO1-like [Syzygium oleosum]